MSTHAIQMVAKLEQRQSELRAALAACPSELSASYEDELFDVGMLLEHWRSPGAR